MAQVVRRGGDVCQVSRMRGQVSLQTCRRLRLVHQCTLNGRDDKGMKVPIYSGWVQWVHNGRVNLCREDSAEVVVHVCAYWMGQVGKQTCGCVLDEWVRWVD